MVVAGVALYVVPVSSIGTADGAAVGVAFGAVEGAPVGDPGDAVVALLEHAANTRTAVVSNPIKRFDMNILPNGLFPAATSSYFCPYQEPNREALIPGARLKLRRKSRGLDASGHTMSGRPKRVKRAISLGSTSRAFLPSHSRPPISPACRAVIRFIALRLAHRGDARPRRLAGFRPTPGILGRRGSTREPGATSRNEWWHDAGDPIRAHNRTLLGNESDRLRSPRNCTVASNCEDWVLDWPSSWDYPTHQSPMFHSAPGSIGPSVKLWTLGLTSQMSLRK